MNINDYTPDNFHPDKFHALKCLWLFRRKQDLFMYYMNQITDSTTEAFLKVRPVHAAHEHLQRETGLSDEDIYHYTLIGNYINEYAEILQMTPEQLQEHIDIYEQDHEVPEDLKDDLEELAQQIVDVIKQNRERDKTFRNIINDNFNNQEKSTDS
jgi:hypothetical protein